MTPEIHHRNSRLLLGLAAVLFVLVMAVSAIPVVHQSELRITDTYFRVAPKPKQASPVVLVLIDDESLREYGRWPWSRTLLARMTANLAHAGASPIGLDVLLAEPQSPAVDAQLREAFAAAGNLVIVDKIGAYAGGSRWVEPLPQLATAVTIGHAQAVQDIDGVCRRFPPLELTPDGTRWAFAVEMARRADPQRTSAFLAAYGVHPPNENDIVTTAPAINVPIAFRRDAFKTISAASVLRDAGLEPVRGHPVLVGFGPTELADRINTPLTGELPAPGVEVHAQILDSILGGRHLHPLPLWSAGLALLAFCIAVVAMFSKWHGWSAAARVGALAALVYVAGLLLFVWASRIVTVGPMLLAIVIGPLLVSAADFVMVERSITHQMRELRRWLTQGRGEHTARVADLSWRLALLQDLQNELGSLYELHRTLLEASQDPVAIFDDAGTLLLSNGPLERIFSGDATAVRMLAQLRAALNPSSEAPLIRTGAIEQGEASLQGELYSVRIAPMPATSLAPRGGTMVTLTSLRARVERDRARAEALGFITHELRTPLMAIQGFAQLMKQHPDSPANATAPETIFRESRRLVALINGYLDVLRMDAGARPLASESIELKANVQEVFSILQPLAEARRMRLVLESEGDVVIAGDAPLISGAVLNLVSNAIKYGQAGRDVRVRCTTDGVEAGIRVHNLGAPIAPDDLRQIFDPYYRTVEAEKTRTGWGLGLAFVKRIAEKHGGSVVARSDDSGTTFEVRLPANMPVAAAKGTS